MDPITASALQQVGGSLFSGAFGGGDTTTTTTSSLDPFQTSSGLGQAGFDGTNFNTSLDPRFLDLQNQAIGASSGAFGQLGAFQNNPFQASNPFDIQGSTQQQFNLLEGLQAQGREDQTLGLEDRLFQQGRLGSTGGVQEQRNLQDFFGQQQRQNQFDAFGQGLQAQGQQFGQDLSSSQQQGQQQQLLSNIGSGMFQTALAPEAALQNQLQVGGAFAPTSSESTSSEDSMFGF